MSARASKKLAESRAVPAWTKGVERPVWIDEVFAASIGFINEKLCDGQMTHRPQRHAETKEPRCFCCGVPTEILIEGSARGHEAMVAHRLIIGGLFRRFAVSGPTPADYAEMFMRVLVPTYNAVWIDVRRCIECGARFDLHSPSEVAERRRCAKCCGE